MSDIIPQDTPQKQCTVCKQWLPATLEWFYANKKGRYGLYARCIGCFRSKRFSVKPLIPPGCKQCSRCKEILPATFEYFFKFKSGLKSACKKCSSTAKPKSIPDGYQRCPVCTQVFPATSEYFHRNKSRSKGIRPQCKACSRSSKRNYTENHGDRTRQADKKWRSANRVANKLRCSLYRQSHPDQYHSYRVNRRALQRNVPGTYTPAQIQEQLKRQKYRCYYAACGFARFPRIKKNGKWKYIYEIEHTFPLSRVVGTGTPANAISYLVLSCHSCNASKNDKFPWEWPEGGRLL